MNDFGFDLRRLRARYTAMGVQLRRLENNHGLAAPNIHREGAGNIGGDGRNQNRRGGGGRNQNQRGGGGGGGDEQNAIIEQLRNLNLDEQALNAVRIAIYDNEARESQREIDTIRVEQRRQRARSLERERRFEQTKLEKAAVKNERSDIAIADADRELEAERLQLDVERAIRRN